MPDVLDYNIIGEIHGLMARVVCLRDEVVLCQTVTQSSYIFYITTY